MTTDFTASLDISSSFSAPALQEFSSDFTMDFSELNDLNGLRFDLESLDQEGWRHVPRAKSRLTEELPLDRPRKLLREPELVEKEGDFLIQSRTGKVWRILRWEEATGSGNRDYYRVSAIEQSRPGRSAASRRRNRERELWVFSSHHQPGFYLFGYFD